MEYKAILEEFVEKMRISVPGDVEAKQEIVRWMHDQMPGIGRVRLKLYKEMLEECKQDLPELEEELEEEIDVIKAYKELPTISPELWEEIRARLQLIWEKVDAHRARIREPIVAYLDIGELLAGVDVHISIEIDIAVRRPDLAAEFEEELADFYEDLAEVEAMLVGADIQLEIRPGVFKSLLETRGLHAVERLVEVAKTHAEKAEAAFEDGRPRKALGLIHAAKTNLEQAEKILECAIEWEEEYWEIWQEYFEEFEELKEELIEEWEEILEDLEERARELRRRWEELPEVDVVSIGDILDNLGFYIGATVIIEGEIVVVGGVLSISDGTGTLPIKAVEDLRVYVGAKVRIEGEIAVAPMVIGAEIRVKSLTVVEAARGVTPPRIRDVV